MLNNSKDTLNIVKKKQQVNKSQKQTELKNQIINSEKKQKQSLESPFLLYSEIFLFNYDLIKQFSTAIRNKNFLLPIIHGYCKHVSTKNILYILDVMMKGRIFNIIVIARRSRHHAGTRYIKRGINQNGFVANFVQIQQIVINHSSSRDYKPVCSSFIQVRGSVPTYWMQRPSIHIPKPAIEIKPDDYMYLATRKHFSDLISRYGNLIYAINLMKMKEKNPRQSLLSKEYQTAVSFINKEDLSQENQIHYIEIDMKYHLRLDKKMFVNKMKTIAYYGIINTGLFMCMNPSTTNNQQCIQIQNGIIRANCVDCLDRTNSFQQLMGQTALSIQLSRLIKQNITFQSCLQLPEDILNVYSKLYEQMGDLISIQYGSSLAHKQKIQKTTQSRFQFLIAITRHVNNNWNDYDRQQQMDIFLGYKPDPNGSQIWEIKPSIDHYLNKELQKLQKIKWYQAAYNKFLQNNFVKQFKDLSIKDKYQRIAIQMQKFTKDNLVKQFNVDIVNALYTQPQNIQQFKFYLKPNQIKQINIFENILGIKKQQIFNKNKLKLHEELDFCFNKMDFLKNQDINMKNVGSVAMGGNLNNFSSEKKIGNNNSKDNNNVKNEQKNQNRKNYLINRSKSPTHYQFQQQSDQLNNIANIKQITSIKTIQKTLQNQFLDQTQIKLIQKYLIGQFIDDDQIQQIIQDYFIMIQNQIDSDLVTQLDIQKQLKQLQINLNNKNYINVSQINQNNLLGSPSRRKKIQTINSLNNASITAIKTGKTIKQQQQKNMKIKQNKILILEQIMKKNFSHGNVHKIEEI